MAYIVSRHLNVKARLLKHALVIKVLDKSFVEFVVRANDLFDLLDVFDKTSPLCHPVRQFLLDRNSLVVMFLVFHYTVGAEKFLGVFCACLDIAVVELHCASITAALLIVG